MDGRKYWTPEEDEYLKTSYENGKSFAEIAHALGRFPKQCSERYLNNLKDDVDKSPLDQGEIQSLIEYQQIHGNQWAKISRLLKEKNANPKRRPANYLKNFWHANMVRKQRFPKKSVHAERLTFDNNAEIPIRFAILCSIAEEELCDLMEKELFYK